MIATILTPDISRLFIFYAFVFVSEAEFHVAQAVLKLTKQLRITLNLYGGQKQYAQLYLPQGQPAA